MACLFVDLDGTAVKFHTNRWLPGVREHLVKIAEAGNQIIFITMRRQGIDDDTEWCWKNTMDLIRTSRIKNASVIGGISVPRFLICDMQPQAISIETDNPNWLEVFA